MPDKARADDGDPDKTAPTNETSLRSCPHPMEMAVDIVFVAVISLGATSGFVNTSEETTTHQAQAINLDLRAPGTVQILLATGETISVEKRTRDLWGKVTISELVRDRTLTIESRCTRRWSVILGDCRADYVIRAPTSTDISGVATNSRVEVQGMRSAIDLTTSNAAITATDVEGPVRLRTSKGLVHIADVVGDATARTSNGVVQLENVTTEGMIDVSNSNGDIAVANTTGSLVLDTDNGRIEVIEARATRVNASTTNRSITITLTTSPRRVVAETRNAGIDIELPADSPAYAIDLTAGNGATRVDSIVDDPNARQSIQAGTQNGDITIRGLALILRCRRRLHGER